MARRARRRASARSWRAACGTWACPGRWCSSAARTTWATGCTAWVRAPLAPLPQGMPHRSRAAAAGMHGDMHAGSEGYSDPLLADPESLRSDR